MAQAYYTLIKKGLKTIDDVPAIWRKAVQALIDADNAPAQEQEPEG